MTALGSGVLTPTLTKESHRNLVFIKLKVQDHYTQVLPSLPGAWCTFLVMLAELVGSRRVCYAGHSRSSSCDHCG